MSSSHAAHAHRGHASSLTAHQCADLTSQCQLSEAGFSVESSGQVLDFRL